MVTELVNVAVSAVRTIKGVLGKYKENNNECGKMFDYVEKLRTDLSILQGSPMMEHPVVRGAMENLNNVLESTASKVTKCQGSSAVLRLLQADGIASKLKQLRDDLFAKMVAALLITDIATYSLVRSMDNKIDTNLKALMVKVDKSSTATYDLLESILKVPLIYLTATYLIPY